MFNALLSHPVMKLYHVDLTTGISILTHSRHRIPRWPYVINSTLRYAINTTSITFGSYIIKPNFVAFSPCHLFALAQVIVQCEKSDQGKSLFNGSAAKGGERAKTPQAHTPAFHVFQIQLNLVERTRTENRKKLDSSFTKRNWIVIQKSRKMFTSYNNKIKDYKAGINIFRRGRQLFLIIAETFLVSGANYSYVVFEEFASRFIYSSSNVYSLIFVHPIS